MKEYIAKFKELWSNKRYRALLILGLYFVFFLAVFLIFSGSPKQEPVSLHGLDLLKTVHTYQYEVTGKQNFSVAVDQGITVKYLDQTYTLDTLPIELQTFPFDMNFHDMIQKGTLESTNYIEHKNTYLYENRKLDVYFEDQDIVKIVVMLEEYIVELEVNYDRTY